VLSLRRRPAAVLDAVVRDLPEDYVALAFGEVRVVVGPTGAFVLADASHSEVGAVARRLAAVARELRHRLVDALSWAPFLDALVVAPNGHGGGSGIEGGEDGRWLGPASAWAPPFHPGDPALPTAPDVDAPVVDPALVRSVLTSGRPRLSPSDIARIRAALAPGGPVPSA
jgi:hypothetical protein